MIKIKPMRALLIIRKNLFRETFYFNILLWLVSIALITSCSKTKEDAIGETIDLIVKVEGVDSDITMPNTKSAARSNYVLLPTDEEAQPSTVTKDDVAFISKSEVQPDKEGFDLKREVYATKSTPMDPGIKYRLLVYTMSNVLVSSVEVTAGQAQRISVTSGATYKWRAYSYNTSDPIPAPDPNNPEVMTPTATTLLYAKGEITPTAPSNILAITFKHQLTQLRVVVKDGSGFRSVISVDGQIGDPNLIKTCAFDLLAGEKKAGTTVPANVSTLDFAPETVQGVTRQVARCYTSDQNIASYGLWINSMKIQYTSTVDRTITDGGGYFAFGIDPWIKTGYILQGTLDIVFRLPTMTILPFSNANAPYRLDPGSAAGEFIRDARNFGPTSNYVRISGLNIVAPSTATLAHESSVGWTRFKNLMTNPATYPDVLIIANWFNYLDDASWDLVKQYIDRGGNVFYLHDEPDPLYEKYAQRGIGNILGQTVSMSDIGESWGVYKFTDTPEGAADVEILNGPFGDVRPFHWGQDRVGSGYINGYIGNNVIAYSTHSQNYKAPSPAGMAFFRHKTKGFFFVGDGGFYLNANSTSTVVDYLQYPFRINPSTKFPILDPYGVRAQTGSPTLGQPGKNVNGGYTIANSMMFGNIMSWMLNRAHYHGINRN